MKHICNNNNNNSMSRRYEQRLKRRMRTDTYYIYNDNIYCYPSAFIFVRLYRSLSVIRSSI